jgi:hypothetical protein
LSGRIEGRQVSSAAISGRLDRVHQRLREIVRRVDGFTVNRARAYLVAIAVWVGAIIAVIVRSSGHEQVSNLGGGLQLVGMFVACCVICGVAFLVSRDVDLRSAAPAVSSIRPDYVRLALLLTFRCWLLLLGGRGAGGNPGASLVTSLTRSAACGAKSRDRRSRPRRSASRHERALGAHAA